MIVTIDGPAGAGKSTVTRLLAKRIGFQFLDTGAMYRAVTLVALREDANLDDPAVLIRVARSISLIFKDDQLFVDGVDVSTEIREPYVTRSVVKIADQPEVREYLVQLQRQIASTGNYVCEGRDQGTVAFPDAFCKIFLTASPHSRAIRRAEQLQTAGRYVDFDQVVREQEIRDRQDASRPVGRLQKARDAIEVNTDHQTLDEVVDTLEKIVREKISAEEG